MPLTEKEAFRTGFLARCAEEGLEPELVSLRLKDASALQAKANKLPAEELQAIKEADWSWGGLIDAARKIGITVPMYAAGLGAVGGSAGGYLAANLRNQLDPALVKPKLSDEIQDIQAAELISTLNREAASARRRAALSRRKREKEERAPLRNRYGVI
mgnify:CR=1 FL=1